MMGGFGIDVSYGRLREACHTDVDGTSVDTIEELAKQLGLDAEQVMVPVDHLILDEAETLPCMVVVKLEGSGTHFGTTVIEGWPASSCRISLSEWEVTTTASAFSQKNRSHFRNCQASGNFISLRTPARDCR